MTTALYLRISEDRGESESIERQRADCHDYAERKGLTIGPEFVDRHVSGFKGKQKALEDLIDSARRGDFDQVLVWKLDRLTRGGVRILFRTLDRLGDVPVSFVTDDIDGSTPMGEAMLGFYAAQARQESENTQLRVKSAQAHNARAGRPKGGGHRPFGFTREWTHVPAEAKCIREGTAAVLEGRTLRSIAADWNERGVTGTQGKPWTAKNVRNVLMAPRIAGWIEHDGQRFKANWKPIVSLADFERVEAFLRARNTGPRVGRPATNLLSGILRCTCGTGLVHAPKGGVNRQYRCPVAGTGHIFVNADGAEGAVTDHALGLLADDRFVQALAQRRQALTDTSAQLTRIATELEVLRVRKSEAESMFAEGELDRQGFKGILATLAPKIAKAEEALREAQPKLVAVPDSKDIEKWFGSMTTEQKREFLGALFERIDVLPTTRRRFHPERLRFVLN